MSFKLKNFNPVNQWQVGTFTFRSYTENHSANSLVLRDEWQVSGVKDHSTGRIYKETDKGTIRKKCGALIVVTPIIQTIGVAGVMVVSALKILTLGHFWEANYTADGGYNLKGRLVACGEDLLRFVGGPIFLIGLELAAIYGSFRPYDGRKIYLSIEEFLYENEFSLANDVFSLD